MSDLAHVPETDRDRELRERATKRLKARRDLQAHTLAFVTVNAFLVVIWYVTGADFFWPVFLIFGWGIGLAFNAWDVYSPGITPDKVDAEVERLRHHSG
ncbi:MAG TPA: 2TM domain-containing protein [Jiangellales bacterium]|nr:2TM domain-containing protein [Jiangellales bacterium]